MKILAILIFLFATTLSAQRDDGLDFGLHSTFVKCYVHHWKGTETTTIPGSTAVVKMTCDGFWGKFVADSKNPVGLNPDSKDIVSSPFELLLPGEPPKEIPFYVWNYYLSSTLAMSEANPLRKHK